MDNFEKSQAISSLEKRFWEQALQTRGIKPSMRHINRLQRHFFNWWRSHQLDDFTLAWTSYIDDEDFSSFIEACQQGQLTRSEVYNLLRDGFGTLSVYRTSYRTEIRRVMGPLIAAGLVEQRVVRGGGHYWQPEHLRYMEFEEYLQMLTDVFFKNANPARKTA